MDAKEFKLTWVSEVNPLSKVDKIKFDFYGFPVELMPSLVKALNAELNFRAISVNHKDERHIQAIRQGITPERQLSLMLKLKHTH